jgi:hypothetical protein
MLLSSFLSGLTDRLLGLSRAGAAVLLSAALLVVILTNGIGVVPQNVYQRLADNPFITRHDIHQENYWQETVLLPVAAFEAHLTTTRAFHILCFASLLAAYALFATLAIRRWGEVAIVVTILLVTSPLTTVLLSWIGTPDPLSVLLTIPFLFITSTPAAFTLTALGTTNHVVVAIAAVGILALRWRARDGVQLRHLLATGAGAAVGIAVVKFFIAHYGIQVMTRLDFILLSPWSKWVNWALADLPLTLYSLLGPQWFVLALCLVMFFSSDRGFFTALLGLLLVNLAITFVSEDTTRVFSLLSWGLLMTCVFHCDTLARRKGEAHRQQYIWALTAIGLASFIAPRYFYWAGSVRMPPFHEFLGVLHLVQ